VLKKRHAELTSGIFVGQPLRLEGYEAEAEPRRRRRVKKCLEMPPRRCIHKRYCRATFFFALSVVCRRQSGRCISPVSRAIARGFLWHGRALWRAAESPMEI